MKAHDFELPDQNGKIHTLADYAGKHLLLYFYPKDMTSGCTLEAQGFRDLSKELAAVGVQVVGVSKDDVKSHKKFEEKEGLNFTLLADEDYSLCEKYGLWVEKSMYGRKYMGIQRDSFLISPEGEVLKHYEKVKPKDHPAEVLKDVLALQE